jgi:hypothetical protein
MGAAGVTVATESLSLACLIAYWVGRRRWHLWSRSLLAVPFAVAVAALASLVLQRLAGDGTATIGLRIVRLGLAGGATALVYVAGVLVLRILPLATIREMLPRGRTAPPGVDL